MPDLPAKTFLAYAGTLKHMDEIGPLSWMNWRAERSGANYSGEGREALLFTDAGVTGFEIREGLGPYSLTNALGPHTRDLGWRIALHVDFYELRVPAVQPPPLDRKTGSRNWIGLSIDQEIACLLSLILGIRLRSSGWSRVFDKVSPNGRACYVEYAEPTMAPVYTHRRMLPGWTGKNVSLTDAGELFRSYPQLRSEDAVALVRAAREYASAVWVAESDPELSWLQLVSAVEVAAGCWDRSISDPTDGLRDTYPELAEELLSRGGEELLDHVARHLSSLIRSRRKFLNFCQSFLPEPPDRDPDWFPQLDWSDVDDIKKRLDKIYEHRSKRLHEATPFPSPLINPGPLATPMEEPLGLGSSNAYSSWDRSSTPLTLYAFAHVVRGTILRWWAEVLVLRE